MVDTNSTSGLARGFALGMVVGLGLAFIYAPRSGEETRYLLGEKMGSVRRKTLASIRKVRLTAASRLMGLPDYSATNFLD